MILAPVTRRIEIAGPDAQPVATGGRLLDPVAPRSHRKSLGDHGRTEVVAGNQARGQQAIVLIHIFGAAVGRPPGEQLRHAVARSPAAGPGPAIGIGAILGQFGRVKAQKPDPVVTEAQAIAIAGPTGPGQGRRRLIEGSRHYRRGDQQPNGQQRPAGAAKQRLALVESGPDFTTR